GTVGSAIVSTAFSDNDGHTVLSIGYPSANVREFTRNIFDVAGNPVYSERDSSSNGVVTVWTTSNSGFDGLNREIASTNRDGAVTLFYRDAAGNVTNQVMPGGALKHQATFNMAGQMLKEWNLGTGGVAYLTNAQTYYPNSSPFAGLLQTRTDGRGVAC